MPNFASAFCTRLAHTHIHAHTRSETLLSRPTVKQIGFLWEPLIKVSRFAGAELIQDAFFRSIFKYFVLFFFFLLLLLTPERGDVPSSTTSL